MSQQICGDCTVYGKTIPLLFCLWECVRTRRLLLWCMLLVNDTPVFIVRTVGWSDKEFFSDFRKRTHCCQLGIFLKVRFRKIVEFGHAWQSLNFQKITNTLTMNIFLPENLEISSFYFKEQSSKTKFEFTNF